MATVIKTRIIKIGNSQGIRLPKLLLDQTNLGEEVELELQESQIVIRPARTPRQNWEEQFQQMAAQGDDQLFDSALLTTTWDEEEWEW
jgi:antitoxin MazE